MPKYHIVQASTGRAVLVPPQWLSRAIIDLASTETHSEPIIISVDCVPTAFADRVDTKFAKRSRLKVWDMRGQEILR